MSQYEEVGQLGPKFTNTFDLQPYPKVCAWCARMEELPFFEEAHAALTELGDLTKAPLEPKRLGVATKVGLKALAAAASAGSKL